MGISFEEWYAEIDGLWERSRAARRSDDHEAALEALRALLDHPCAHHRVVAHEVLDEMFMVLRELGRFDEAIDAKRAAIAAGYRSSPDPEADIAECMIESGRRADGDSLFAVLHDRTPDDPWLYNPAGFAYRRVDDRESLRWLLDGIEVAIATGDHDQLVGQLIDMVVEQWERLGESPDDELVARVEAFIAGWTRPAFRSRSWPEATPTPIIEVAAYRTVIEAVTNSIGHGHAGQRTIRVRADTNLLHIQADDDGTAPGAWTSGVGLPSMRELGAELVGTIDAGPLETGGARVGARSPIAVVGTCIVLVVDVDPSVHNGLRAAPTGVPDGQADTLTCVSRAPKPAPPTPATGTAYATWTAEAPPEFVRSDGTTVRCVAHEPTRFGPAPDDMCRGVPVASGTLGAIVRMPGGLEPERAVDHHVVHR